MIEWFHDRLIPAAVRYSLESVPTLRSLPESPYLKRVDFQTFYMTGKRL